MTSTTETMPTVTELEALGARLSGTETADDDAQRIGLLTALESVKSACAAAQARVTVSFDASRRREQAALGAAAAEQGKAIGSQVALARHESSVKGNRLLGLSRALVTEMLHTLAALAAGRINEWRATIVVRETATLSAVHRARVDAELAGRLDTLGDRGAEWEARKIAYRLDPASALRRARTARSDRRVTVRPAPDTMSYLTGFLPAEQGIAVHTALTRFADSLRARGDTRSRGQIMADTLVERVTGQAKATGTPTTRSRSRTAERPPRTTVRHCASSATRPRRLPAGLRPRHAPVRGRPRPSRSPRPPATATPPGLPTHRQPAEPAGRDQVGRGGHAPAPPNDTWPPSCTGTTTRTPAPG